MYKYRTSDKNESIKEISFEFFQLFRYIDHQERWAIDILLALNGDPTFYGEYDVYRLYNLFRLIRQIELFGFSERLHSYKFLYYFRSYWFSTVNKDTNSTSISEEDILIE